VDSANPEDLGDKFETKVILAAEKRRHKAEITIIRPTADRWTGAGNRDGSGSQ